MAGAAWSMFYWNKNKSIKKGKRNKFHNTHPLRVTNLMASRHMRPLHGQGRGCSREGGVQGHPPSSPAGINQIGGNPFPNWFRRTGRLRSNRAARAGRTRQLRPAGPSHTTSS